MVPVVALVGRPNVGKSTLFNRLTRTRDALVADFPGLTRDRKYGQAKLGEHEFIVIDTGGIDGSEEGVETKMAQQSLAAIDEADVVLFMVDGRAGLTRNHLLGLISPSGSSAGVRWPDHVTVGKHIQQSPPREPWRHLFCPTRSCPSG